MISYEIRQIAHDAAGKYNLPANLILSIIDVESGGDPWAIRYEPAFYTRYIAGKPTKVFGSVSKETEQKARATSWGLMQIMGQVARERGFKGPFLSELCDPETGIKWGCHHLDSLRSRFLDKAGWDGVAAAYNAGSPIKNKDGSFVNQGYVNKIRDAGGLNE